MGKNKRKDLKTYTLDEPWEESEIKMNIFKRLKAEKKKHLKRCSFQDGYEMGYMDAQKISYDEFIQLTSERWFETEAGAKWTKRCRDKFRIYTANVPENIDSCFTYGWLEGMRLFCNKLNDQLYEDGL